MASKENMVKAKTWSGAKLERTPSQLKARTKNIRREYFPTETQYPEDVKAYYRKKDIRAEPGPGPMRRIFEDPYGSLKARAARKPIKKK